MNKKIIAVIGATGAQGGGLVRAILADKGGAFVPRAITRKPDSEKGKDLSKMGVEVVAADLDDPPSLRAAFNGAHGAFCLTNFWEYFSPEKEIAQAKALAQAAKDAGVAHAIWSTLADTRKRVPLSDGRMLTLKENTRSPTSTTKGSRIGSFGISEFRRRFWRRRSIGRISSSSEWARRKRTMESSLWGCRWPTRSFPESPSKILVNVHRASSSAVAISLGRRSVSPASI
jgi:NAD(P)-dependent dehydrogenase (short-subunit alcohol dehydrogenase family)